MNITTKEIHDELNGDSRSIIEEKLAPIGRLLGDDEAMALLEVEVERAPAQGRSSEPYKMVANLKVTGKTFHAEAVKPSVESAADKVREELSQEIRKSRGRAKHLLKRGGAALKSLLRGVSE